ncbi:MAG: type II secretion system F family protein [Armatimonadota bacterium]|nr:type II secretion system F family protein [Armatimonadota bacterium]
MLAAIVILSFSSVTLLVIGITMKTERELIRERVDRYSYTGETLAAPLHPELLGSFGDRIIRPFLRKLATIATKLTPAGHVATIDAKLERAGRPWKLGALEFIGLRVLSVCSFLALGYFAYLFMKMVQPNFALLFGIIMVFVGLILPDYILQKAIEQRQTQIRKALPDTIDLLTVSVEAGVGFDGAMAKVSEKMKGPLTDELIRALDEMRLGKPRMQALRDVATRLGMLEVTTFVAALYQAEQLGVSIAKVLRVQGDTMRTRRSQRARETAAKMPVMMLFPLVFFIFPALFVVVLGPGLIQIYRALSQ